MTNIISCDALLGKTVILDADLVREAMNLGEPDDFTIKIFRRIPVLLTGVPLE